MMKTSTHKVIIAYKKSIERQTKRITVLKAHLHRARRHRQRKVVHQLRRKIDRAVIRVYVNKAILKQVIAKREVIRAKEARHAVHKIKKHIRHVKAHHRVNRKQLKHL